MMKGLLPMVRKEALEIRYTSRKWVLPAAVAFCGVLASLLAYYYPQGAKSGGIDPTAVGACSLFFTLLSSLGILAIIMSTAGIVSSEIRNGTAVLVLTKPISRKAFLLAKMISQCAVVLAATLVGTAVFSALTYALFKSVPWASLLAGVGLWLPLAMLFTVLMVLLSSRIKAQAELAGVGLYILLSLLGRWSPAKLHTPAGIGNAMENLLRAGGASWMWPLATTLVVAAVLVLFSGRIFARREI